MKTIIDYFTVCQKNLVQLDNAVRARIAQGWQPIGGVAVADDRITHTEGGHIREQFIQAMVRYEDATPPPNPAVEG